MRIRVIRLQKDTVSGNEATVINIYRVEITDLLKKGFFLVKRQKEKALDLANNQNYILDMVRLCFNKKGEVVLSTTAKTVIREEKDDTFTI